MLRHTLALVILIATMSSRAFSQDPWDNNSIDLPAAPTITTIVPLNGPTVQAIENAIADNTKVVITGTVDTQGGNTISIDDDHVILDFSGANDVAWSGSDTWGGFIEISGHHIQILGLDMNVATTSSGRCRGVKSNSASDLKISGCTFTRCAEGMNFDGEFQRVQVIDSAFLNTTDWPSTGMTGGYCIFFNDDDTSDDHIRFEDLILTQSSNVGQHAVRLVDLQYVRIHECQVSSQNDRALWMYGVYGAYVSDCDFDNGFVLLGVQPNLGLSDRETELVRIGRCSIDHTMTGQPLEIWLSDIVRDVRVGELEVTSTTASYMGAIGYYQVGQFDPYDIAWLDGTSTFQTVTVYGCDAWAINIDPEDLQADGVDLASLTIGPTEDIDEPGQGCGE